MAVLRMQSADRQSTQPTAVQLQLARLAAALSAVDDVPVPQVPSLLSQLAAAQSALAAAQVNLLARMLSPGESRIVAGGDDRWLSTDEAADLLKVDRKWLYRRSKSLPFSRRLSRKKLLFSEVGLREWMATRRA
jgi:hypothetical protein